MALMAWKINPRLLAAEPMQRCVLGECHAACCLYGVWLGEEEVERIFQNSAQIAKWMPPERGDPAGWMDGRREEDGHLPGGWAVHSTVVTVTEHYGGTACVFLRSDSKCALQVAGEAAGLHPWHFKPFYCILHPLDLDEEGRITLDETRLLLDEPASCLRPAPEPVALLETFAEELRYFLGEEEWCRLWEVLGKRG